MDLGICSYIVVITQPDGETSVNWCNAHAVTHFVDVSDQKLSLHPRCAAHAQEMRHPAIQIDLDDLPVYEVMLG
jgi:hypothetical protein